LPPEPRKSSVHFTEAGPEPWKCSVHFAEAGPEPWKSSVHFAEAAPGPWKSSVHFAEAAPGPWNSSVHFAQSAPALWKSSAHFTEAHPGPGNDAYTCRGRRRALALMTAIFEGRRGGALADHLQVLRGYARPLRIAALRCQADEPFGALIAA